MLREESRRPSTSGSSGLEPLNWQFTAVESGVLAPPMPARACVVPACHPPPPLCFLRSKSLLHPRPAAHEPDMEESPVVACRSL